jgi:hypothetical protein
MGFWLALAFVTVHADNPAGRLHNVITSLATHASQQQMWQAWAAALQIPGDQLSELLRRVALVYDLPAEIVSELDCVPGTEYDRDLVLRWQPEVAGLLGTNLFGTPTASQSIQGVTRESLYSLENCSYILHRFRPQPGLSDDEQERIAQMISELQEAVLADPDMDADLGVFLLYHAGQMSRALRDLPVRGRAALEDAFDQAVGAVNRRMDLTSRAEENPRAWAMFRDLMLVIAAVLAIAQASLTLPGQIRQELEGPPPAPPPIVKVIEQPPPPPDAPAPEAQRHRPTHPPK